MIGRLFRQRSTVRSAPLFELDRLLDTSRRSNIATIRGMCQTALVGSDTTLCRVLGRYKMYVDSTDVGLSSHLMLDGYWELWVTEPMVARLRPGMTCIDVGANVGYFTMVMAERAGPGGIVHAFEPNPPIARRLALNAHVNGLKEQVVLHAEALGERDGGRFLLHVPENYPGGASLSPAPEDAAEGAGAIEVRRLDSYPELLDADLIKIDAEGSERSIWRGMAGILARRRPLVIFLEFVKNRYEDPGDFIDEITAEGFTIRELNMKSGIVPITREAILGRPREDDIMLMLTR